MEPSSGVALVTTAWLRSRERGSRHVEVLNAFLLYHISIGFDRIFVFFDGDETQQPTADVLRDDVRALVDQGRVELLYRRQRGGSDVSCQRVSSVCGVEMRYADCRNFEKLRAGLEDGGDVSSRQMLHAEMAMRRCVELNKSQKIKWLLHLDIDELFFCEGFASSENEPAKLLRQWVATLDNATEPIDQLTIVNYEAVPTSLLGGNYFVSATKFRRHTSRIPLSTESQKALREWQRRSPYDQFFLFYDNGKSIVRVPTEADADFLIPASVHHWKPTTGREIYRLSSNFYDPRRSDCSVWQEPQRHLRCCVLHYPVCGLEWFTEKYERLGAFPDVWGGATNLKIHPCFHLQARDASCLEEGCEAAMEKLFKGQVMVETTGSDDDPFWKSQLSSGVCEEITFPQELLKSKGFLVELGTTTREVGTAMPARTPVTIEQKPTPKDTASNGFTVEKAWMLAAISDQYL